MELPVIDMQGCSIVAALYYCNCTPAGCNVYIWHTLHW